MIIAQSFLGEQTMRPKARHIAFMLLAIILLLAPLSQASLGAQMTFVWYRTWGGPTDDAGLGMTMDTGGIYLTGYADSFGAGLHDVLVLKYSLSGTLLWERTWGGSQSDEGWGIATDQSGGILVAGWTDSSSPGHEDVLLLKFSAETGDLIWSRTFGENSTDQVFDMTLDSSGNIYVSGLTLSPGSTGYDALLLKLNSTGYLLWQRTWGGNYTDVGRGIATDSYGDIYQTGQTKSSNSDPGHVFLLKWNSTGSLLWEKVWGGSGLDYGSAVAADPSGSVYVAGYTYSLVGGGGSQLVVLKIDTSGNLLWQRAWGRGSEYGRSITVDSAGDVYVSGVTYALGAGLGDVALLKLDAAGDLIDQRVWGGVGYDDGWAVVSNAAGDAFITGLVSEGPPYNITAANYSLIIPKLPLNDTIIQARNSTLITMNPSGSLQTPSGIQNYAGQTDLLLLKYGIPLSADTLPSLTVTFTVLLLGLVISRARRFRLEIPL